MSAAGGAAGTSGGSGARGSARGSSASSAPAREDGGELQRRFRPHEGAPRCRLQPGVRDPRAAGEGEPSAG